jgi:hypothetical protein
MEKKVPQAKSSGPTAMFLEQLSVQSGVICPARGKSVDQNAAGLI